MMRRRIFSDDDGRDAAEYNPNMVKVANALLSFSNPASPVSSAMTSTLGPRHVSATAGSGSGGVSHSMSFSKSTTGSPSAESSGETRAFAKLQGRTWTYYIQKVSVTLGRTVAEPSSESGATKISNSEIDVDLGIEATGVSRKHLRIDYAGANGWEMYCFGKTGVTVDGVHYEAFCQPIQLGAKTLISVDGADFYFLLPLGIYSTTAKAEAAANEEAERARAKIPDNNGEEVSAAKPYTSYACLIAEAINSSPEQRLTLSDIYKYLMDKYPYFRQTKNGWQNSIRHNLSLNKAFLKIPRAGGEPGKGMFWVIDRTQRHLVEGKGYQRRSSGTNARHRAGPNHANFTPYQHPNGRTQIMVSMGEPSEAEFLPQQQHRHSVYQPAMGTMMMNPHDNSVPVRAMSTINIPRSMLAPSPAHNMLLEAAEALEKAAMDASSDFDNPHGEEPNDADEDGTHSAPNYQNPSSNSSSYSDNIQQQQYQSQHSDPHFKESRPFHPQPNRPFVFNRMNNRTKF